MKKNKDTQDTENWNIGFYKSQMSQIKFNVFSKLH